MKYCSHCHITYETPLEHCLFCSNPLTPSKREESASQNTIILNENSSSLEPINDSTFYNYPMYTKIKHTSMLFRKTIFFLTLITDMICFLIDILKNNHLTWSLTVITTMTSVILGVLIVTKRCRILKKIIQIGLLLDIFLLFLGMIAGSYHWCTDMICFLIDILKNNHLTWSLTVITTMTSVILGVLIVTKRCRIIKKIIQIGLLLDIFLLFLGMIAGSYHWCTDIFIPISIMVLETLALCFVIGSHRKIYDYSIYVLSLCILGLLLGLLLLTQIIATPWGIVVQMTYSIILLIGLFLFSPKAMWEELSRRFFL